MEKTLILGKIEGKRRIGLQRMRWLDSITYSVDMNLSKPQEKEEDREAWHAAVTENINSVVHLCLQSAFNQWRNRSWGEPTYYDVSVEGTHISVP